jgi:CRP-like cAMP-binding protein
MDHDRPDGEAGGRRAGTVYPGYVGRLSHSPGRPAGPAAIIVAHHPDIGETSPVPSDSPLIRKMEALVSLGPAERDFLDSLIGHQRSVPARTELIHQGDRYKACGVLHEGWAIRYKTLSDGRRHIINFLLPGDFFGLFAALMETADHCVATLTPGALSMVDTGALAESFRRYPKIGAALAWFGAREEALIAERATGLGRRSALERMAHMLLELLKRLEVVALAHDNRYELPVSQEILADTLGLSLVHANRTLRRLRERGLIDLDGQTIFLRNVRVLRDIADFDELYLHLRRMPKRVERQFSAA